MLGRLLYSGLLSRYRWLALFLCYDAVKSIVLSNVNFHTGLEYSRFYVISHAPLLVLQCAVVAELFNMVIEAYPRIGMTAKILFRSCLCIALVTSLIIAVLTANPGFPFWLTAALVAEKAVDIGCTILICCQALFFLVIHVPMRGNLVRHRFVLTVWWLASGASLVLLMPRFSALGDLWALILFAVTSACCLAWTVTFRSAGEKDPDRGLPLSNEEVDRAMRAYSVSQAVQRHLRDLGSD